MIYSPQLLFVSAAPFEGGGLFLSNQSLDYLSVGIGIIEATKNSSLSRSRFVGKDVVFLGSAGTFGEFKEPIVYSIEQVIWKPLCERQGSSYQVPKSEPIQLKPHSDLTACPQATAVCASNITSVEHTYGEGDGTYLENIELYSCALAAIDVCKSFTALLVSTNKVRPDSHLQWKENHLRAAKCIETYLKSSILAD